MTKRITRRNFVQGASAATLAATLSGNPLRAQDAPSTAFIEAISSSIWIYTPPTWGSRVLILSAVSVAGVIG